MLRKLFGTKVLTFRDLKSEQVKNMIVVRFGKGALEYQKRMIDNKELIPTTQHTALVFDCDSGICVGGIAYNDRVVYAFSMVEGLLPQIRNIKGLKW